MILYLKSQYSTNIRNQIVLIQDFPRIEEVSFFEGIQEELRMALKEDHLPIIKRNDLCQLHECLVTEMRIGKKKCFFTCLYRSPSQTSDEFEDFYTDLNLFLSNINDLHRACSVITGDFNARSPE